MRFAIPTSQRPGSCTSSAGRWRLRVTLHKTAAPDDRRDMRALVLEQAKVSIGIAVYDQKIGERARGDLAEPAGLADDFGVDQRRGPDDLLRAHHLRADQELAAVIVLQLA